MGLTVKHWDAHTASKQHKTSLQRIKQEQDKEKERAKDRSSAGGKAKRRDVAAADEYTDVSEAGPSSSKRQRVEGKDPSDPQTASRMITTSNQETNGGGGGGGAVDSELDAFLSSLNETESTSDAQGETGTASTVAAAATSNARKPYKLSEQESQTTYEAAPAPFHRPMKSKKMAVSGGEEDGGEQEGDTAAVSAGADQEEEEAQEESEATRRARLALEEREEIMDRLEEESRAQEDADQRVMQMKARLEAVKKLREERQRRQRRES